MALNGCSSGLLVTAVVALLLLPLQYFVPEQYAREELPPAPPDSAFGTRAWLDDGALVHLPLLNLFMFVTFLVLGMSIYLCEWIQIKLMERRIVKLNQYLASVERLRTMNTRQAQLEGTLMMVQNATTEYNGGRGM